MGEKGKGRYHQPGAKTDAKADAKNAEKPKQATKKDNKELKKGYTAFKNRPAQSTFDKLKELVEGAPDGEGLLLLSKVRPLYRSPAEAAVASSVHLPLAWPACPPPPTHPPTQANVLMAYSLAAKHGYESDEMQLLELLTDGFAAAVRGMVEFRSSACFVSARSALLVKVGGCLISEVCASAEGSDPCVCCSTWPQC